MATTYSFQKGKYGGPCGAIFPFFRNLTSNSPADAQYYENIPAGFLPCKGQILSADQYPALAEILGVGDACLYKKTGTTLQNRDEDGTGGTFQLPDLGSKYISASSNPGLYNNMTVTNTTSTTTIYRAGIEVELQSVGNELTFTYSGNFSLPSHSLTVAGNWTVQSSTITGSANISEGQILPHGHFADFAQLFDGASTNCNTGGWKYQYRFWGACYNSASFGGNCGAVVLTPMGNTADEIGTDTGTNHTHGNANISITSQTKSGTMSAISISSAPIQTVVRLNTGNTVKIDSVSPMFILCEYLIKY